MGAKHSFRSSAGGGPLLYAPIYSRIPFFIQLLRVPFPARIGANFQTIVANFRQKGAKVNDFLGVLGVFSGKSETKKGKS